MKYANNTNKTNRNNAKSQGLAIAAISLALVAVIASGFLFFNAIHKAPTNTAAQPTAAIATTAQVAPAAKVAPTQAAKAAEKPAATQAPKATQPAPTQAPTQAPKAQPATQPAAQPATEKQENNNIRVINGERVFIDTKRPVPAVAGTPAFYYNYGKTSYGFNWDYSADNANFLLRCDYNFAQQQYQFGFYGKEAGVAHVTLYYFTDDNTKVPVQMTVTVDADLNVTLAY